MIDRPTQKSKATHDVHAPHMDNAMSRAVSQLHEIAQASASQKESDAKILAAAISSAHTLRDVWHQKATRWRRAMWGCVIVGILASGTIGLISWTNSRQSYQHQLRLRREIVKQNDEINNLRAQAHIPPAEVSLPVENTKSTSHIETMITDNALETNLRFDALALGNETLATNVIDLAHNQNDLLLAMTHMLDKFKTNSASPHRPVVAPLPQKTTADEAFVPTTTFDATQHAKMRTSSVRLLGSKPIESDARNVFTNVTALTMWPLPDGYLNASGHCIPGRSFIK